MLVEDEPAEDARTAAPAQNHSPSRLVGSTHRGAALRGVGFYFGSHNHRMLGLTRADHLDANLARVEESDRAIEHVEGECLSPIRGFDVVVHPELARDERGDGRFGDELVAIHPGIDHQAKLRAVDSAVVEARRGGLARQVDHTPRRGLTDRCGADPFDPNPGRRQWLWGWLA